MIISFTLQVSPQKTHTQTHAGIFSIGPAGMTWHGAHSLTYAVLYCSVHPQQNNIAIIIEIMIIMPLTDTKWGTLLVLASTSLSVFSYFSSALRASGIFLLNQTSHLCNQFRWAAECYRIASQATTTNNGLLHSPILVLYTSYSNIVLMLRIESLRAQKCANTMIYHCRRRRYYYFNNNNHRSYEVMHASKTYTTHVLLYPMSMSIYK